MEKRTEDDSAGNVVSATDAAGDHDIAMTDEHWKILGFMRDYRIDNRIPASIDDVVRFLAEDLAYGDRARSRLFELFPHTHALFVCKTRSGVE